MSRLGLAALSLLVGFGVAVASCADEVTEVAAGSAGGGPSSAVSASSAVSVSSSAIASSANSAASSTSASSASSSASSASSGGGGGGCVEIMTGAWTLNSASVPGTLGDYATTLSPNQGTADPDLGYLELRTDHGGLANGGDLGTFDLAASGDIDPNTCSRCFVFFIDGNSLSFQGFEAGSGSITIEPGSDPLNGVLQATITDVKLYEPLGPPQKFGPIPGPDFNGPCMHIASATISTMP